MAVAFDYPAQPHVRKHGPQGYADYASFRPWLRDEFAFCCIYCRTREQWGRTKRMFDLDHFVPQALKPDQEANYDNLLYACRICNGAKAHQSIPKPESFLTDDQVEVHADGSINGLTPGAEQIIWRLGLDDPEFRNWRLLWLRIVDARSKGTGVFSTIDPRPLIPASKREACQSPSRARTQHTHLFLPNP